MTQPKRLAVLRIVVLISLAFRASTGSAMGLGPMRLQSALGQSLQASVQIFGPEARTLADNCIRGKLLAPDGSELLRAETEIKRRNGLTEVIIASKSVVEEPAVTLSIEVTCAPEMHRDYQLLLDLRDGLPRVVTQEAPVAVARKREPARRRTGASGETGVERGESGRGRIAPVAAESGLGADAMAASTDSAEAAVRSRARGLPGARNVLKLSQADLDTGKKSSKGLRLSDSLSTASTANSVVDSEDILAAKARFLAMMRNEDPMQAAQRQIRGLQAQLQQPARLDAAAGTARATAPAGEANASDMSAKPVIPALPSASIAANATAAPAKTPGGAAHRFANFNFWMIGLGSLLLAIFGVLAVMYRGARRSSPKMLTPWWMNAADNRGREEDLMQAARDIAATKKPGFVAAASSELDRMLAKDELLHRYVSEFTQAHPSTDVQTGRRVEPSSLGSISDDSRVQLAAALSALSAKPAVSQSQPATLKPSVVSAPVATPTTPPQPEQKPFDPMHDDLPLPRRSAVEAFELVSDVMQEAEFWKMLNETKRAIDILEAYCQGDSASSPVPWLYLADLYLSLGDMQGYAALQASFCKRFNGRLADEHFGNPDAESSETGVTDVRRSLEDFPHVMEQISRLWGNHEVVPFLQGLLINQRDSPRQGFNLPVYREILLLIDVAREREQEIA